MITAITLPKLGVEMETARLAEWAVAEGDTVAEGDVIASVETEKVVFELPSPAAGRIHLDAELDQEYEIGARLGAIADTAAEYESLLATNGAAAPAAELRDALTVRRRGGEPLATPVARRVASAHNIDLSTIAGTGARGAIRRRDIEAAIARVPEPAAAPSRVVQFSSMRRTIAKRMHASLQDTAQMTDIREHDVSALVDLRTRAVARTETLGFKLSYTALFARAAIMALEAVPILNSSLASDTELRQWNTVNLGMAVTIGDGLLVPVVRGAERLSVRQLNEQLDAVIARARDRTASTEELSGGTFTVTNFGSYGSHIGTPILMPPQVGILGIGAMLERPVVRAGEIAVGKVIYTCLTVDHRVIDGEAAGRFQNALGRLLAEPELLLFG